MSRGVMGFIVRAYLKTGEIQEFRFAGTGHDVIRKAQDKERELLEQKGADLNAVYLVAAAGDRPAPSQADRHRPIAR